MTKEIIKDGSRYRVIGENVEVYVVAPGRRPFWRRVARSTFIYAWVMAEATGAPRPYIPERTPSQAVLASSFDKERWS